MPLTRLLTDLLTQTTLGETEARDLRCSAGGHSLAIGRAVMRGLAVEAAGDAGLQFVLREAELTGVTVAGPLARPAGMGAPAHDALVATTPPPDHATAAGAAPSRWCLEPLAGAEGTLRARITDAHFLFDADVTVPLRQGSVDFNQATVEHVGPDSRMGVSRMGVYVDAPNGRSYLYQFDAAPVEGVRFEQRGSLFQGLRSALGGDRGSIRLQPFSETLLRQAGLGLARGVTDQLRLLLARTAAEGRLRLGDGKLCMPGVQLVLASQAADHNTLTLSSDALGHGLTVSLPALAAREASVRWGRASLVCDTLSAQLTATLARPAATSFELSIDKLMAQGVRLTLG